jgi:hypothetical protein
LLAVSQGGIENRDPAHSVRSFRRPSADALVPSSVGVCGF